MARIVVRGGGAGLRRGEGPLATYGGAMTPATGPSGQAMERRGRRTPRRNGGGYGGGRISGPNACTLGLMVEPKMCGELGYVDCCILLVEAGICSCDWCGGHLVDQVCLSCGCRHEITGPTRFHGRGLAWIPVAHRGRCAHADAVHAERERERELQARKRWAAEELGDPQR